MKASDKCKKRVTLYAFVILMTITLKLGAEHYYLQVQLGHLSGNFMIYDSAARYRQFSTPGGIAGGMDYAYRYYPPGTKWIRDDDGILAQVMEQGCTMALTLMRIQIEEKLGTKFTDEDIFTIVEKYTGEEISNKEYWLENRKHIDLYRYASSRSDIEKQRNKPIFNNEGFVDSEPVDANDDSANVKE